jgi:hypothetical protein
MPSTFVYLAFSADRSPKEVEYASAADDFERMARFAQVQETGNEGWKSWALANNGEVIIMNGDEGRIRIPAEKLTELPHLRSQYAETVGATVSVGVGAKMSEADKALQAAQKAGGDRIRLYDQSVEEDLAAGLQKTQAAFHDPRTGKVYPTGSIHDLEGLPEELQQDAIDGKVLSGFVGDDGKFFQRKPKLPHLAKAEGRAYAEIAGAGTVPPQRPTTAHPLAPEPPQTGDPEPSEDEASPQLDMDQLHDTMTQMASQQGQQDSQDEQVQQAAEAKGQAHGDLTKRVAAILQVFKARASELEQLQQADPELYQSLVGMLQAMVEMARSVQGGDSNPGEDSGAEVKKSESSCPMCGAEPGTDIDCPECLAYDKVEVSPEESFTEDSELHKDSMPGGKGDDAPDEEFAQDDLEHGVKEERKEHGLDAERAKEIVKDHLTEDDEYYAKAALDPGKTGRHEVNYPVGSTKEPGPGGTKDAGKIKIQKPDGSTTWRSVRAGLIMDTEGRPISSRRQSS